ncbi:hypothetical protein [Verrucomicrobium sp. BvORR106]|uniref:hypothetical protein n=1 Tax=Verrucomicrobium sp. BvORR106 TaxID=1403819 RepID=UPI0022410456|nr:hypothetical protein [Verrucomicrobium sp. BvORR106]
MKKPPMTNSYWLSRDGAEVQGPYSLQQILKMHQVDPFPAETPMKDEGSDEWSTLEHWIPSAKPRPAGPVPHPTALEQPPRTKVFIWLVLGVLLLTVLAYWLTAL